MTILRSGVNDYFKRWCRLHITAERLSLFLEAVSAVQNCSKTVIIKGGFVSVMIS